jgi:selenide, water dikinase
MNEIDINFLNCTEQGGCSAKFDPSALEILVRGLPGLKDDRLIVGTQTHDDAAVWKLNDEVAIISTTDFFPPCCSNAYDFGQIAAANALSDIYAMGGEAIMALNLVMYPADKMPFSGLQQILRGGADKIKEAGAVLAGGHTISDHPPKYGLAVTGVVHPEKIVANSGAQPGDVLILTKPLGTGALVAGKKVGIAKEEDFQLAIHWMKMLNRQASRLMQEFIIRGGTDITGFGLLGHGLRMAQASKVQLKLTLASVPIFPGVYDLLEQGCIPGGAFRNQKFVAHHVQWSSNIKYNEKMILFDPQTSGGILMSVASNKVDPLVSELKKTYPATAVIGEVLVLEGEKYLAVE